MEKSNQEEHPLRSVHTNTLVEVLNTLNISLLITTYQAGKLIVVRSEGEVVNTHFRVFDKPMGMAKGENGFALGSGAAIWEFRNVPTAAKKIDEKYEHDGCFIPKNVHITGDIDIHEMEYIKGDLWFINTKFSCLCTKDDSNSFTPRWKPPFITGYDMTDRCHLNGLSSRDGSPRYVTALGESDKAMGWRENKAFGGILMDIESSEILARDLSMPHSPRWYQGKLWILESGRGSLGYYDFEKKEVVSVAKVPGFTRGIDFCGNLAFIGLSKVRESTVFSGIPLTKEVSERICGVWVVNIESGDIIGFLRFEEGVEEIFAVTVLQNTKFPEVVEFNQPLMHSSYVVPDETIALLSSENKDLEVALPHFEKGNELYNNGKKEEAIEEYKIALKIQPDYIPAKYNIAITYGDLKSFSKAEEILREIISEDAAHVDSLNSLGFVLNKQGRYEEAIESFEKAIKIKPSYAQAHFNLGMNLLLKGDFKRGWREYEWRFKTPHHQLISKQHPKWEGEDISDKTLLLHTEQGNGDAIMMARYISEVKKRCKKLLLVCTPNLQPLFEQFSGIDEIRNAGDIPVGSFDTFCPIMSLPIALGFEEDKMPQESYIFGDKSRLPIDKKGKKLTVGLTWAGSKTHLNDYRRSLALETFAPLFQLEDIHWISLQKDDGIEELSASNYKSVIESFDERIRDYGDTASIVSQVDLIISVDTSTAHLGGAMGKSTWVILSKVPEWRWRLESEKSSWYPSVTLFRQKDEENDFSKTVERVKERLMELL